MLKRDPQLEKWQLALFPLITLAVILGIMAAIWLVQLLCYNGSV